MRSVRTVHYGNNWPEVQVKFFYSYRLLPRRDRPSGE